MGLFQLHDGDAESRDDIVRMEIEADTNPDLWDFMQNYWARVESAIWDQDANDRELEIERDL